VTRVKKIKKKEIDTWR